MVVSKFIRRTTLFWALIISTIAIGKFLFIASDIDGSASVFLSIIGLVAVAIGLYKWDLERSEK